MRRSLDRALASLVLLLVPGPLRAATPPPAEVPGVSAQVTVSLVQVEVRVVDKDGRFVSGLGVDDFDVLEDGKPRPVQFVDEFRPDRAPADASAASAPEPAMGEPAKRQRSEDLRSLLIVVDGANSGAAAIARQRKFLEDFVEPLAGSDTLVALFELRADGVFEQRSRFTRDTGATLAAIRSLRLGQAGGDDRGARIRELETLLEQRMEGCRSDVCRESAFDRVLEAAGRNAQEERNRAINSIESIKGLLGVAGHMPGSKTLLLVSEGLDPGGVVYFNAAAKLFRYYSQNQGVRDTQRWVVAAQRGALANSSDLLAVQALSETALSAGVTVHWVNPSHEGDVITISPESQSGGFAVGTSDIGVPDATSSMLSLARETGGLAARRAADLSSFYQRLREDLGRYYLVSFVPGRDHHDGATHSIQVIPRNKAHKIRARERYTDHLPEDRVRRKLASAVDFPDAFAELESPASVSFLLTGENRFTLRSQVAVPYRELSPQVRDGSAIDVVHFGFLVRDSTGAIVLNEHPYLNIREDFNLFNQLSSDGAALEYRYATELPPGRYTFVAAVLDASGERATGHRFELLLPEPGEKCLTVAPLLLARSSRTLSERVDALTFAENGDLRYADQELSFSAIRELPPSGRLTGIYQLLNAAGGADGAPDVEMFFRLYRGEAFVNQTPPTALGRFTQNAAITGFFAVPYTKLAPGEYRLELFARDKKSDCTSIGSSTFTILAGADPATTETTSPRRQ